MGLDAMQAVVARLLTSRVYQAEFFAARPEDAQRHGLTPDEMRALRRIDPRKLGIRSEGYAGKRLERVASAFPLALEGLDRLLPAERAAYLLTPFPPDEEAERATFLAFLRRAEGWPEPVARLLRDVAALEHLLVRHPFPAAPARYRMRPDLLRPARGPLWLTVRAEGPLPEALRHPPIQWATLDYPEAPGSWLVVRDGGRVALHALEGLAGALLADCDGAHSLAQLEAAHGPAAVPHVESLLRAHVLVDAA